MFKVKLNKGQKKIISLAAKIQLAHLIEVYENKQEYQSVKDIFNSQNNNPKLEGLDLSLNIADVIDDLITDFEELEKHPEWIDKMEPGRLNLITLILAEYFETYWQNYDDDFIDLCQKLVKLSDSLNE